MWTKKYYEGIEIILREDSVEITNDKKLQSYLRGPGNPALDLADYLLSYHSNIFDDPLDISRDSMAIEILAHVHMDDFVQYAATMRFDDLSDLDAFASSHTGIIDCGELNIDPNRHIWDALTPFSHMIYKLVSDWR